MPAAWRASRAARHHAGHPARVADLATSTAHRVVRRVLNEFVDDELAGIPGLGTFHAPTLL
ncbi:hypothetical protein ACWDG9_18425 [Streptomyces sp. NPDC001073]